MTRPACRMMPGSFSSPKTSSARTPRIAISGRESTASPFPRCNPAPAPQRRQGPPAPPCKDGRPVKIIYTRGNRTETLASLATLRKILNRFVAHRVFYEVSSRNKRGHEFFSAKNVFVVGSIEVVNRDYLTITIFDGNSQAHSIEILNPATMRIYDEMPGKGFAVSFISDTDSGVESRCYLRDEGEDGEGKVQSTALEKIT